MMSHERQSQASTPMVVAKDNLKAETKGYSLQNKNKIDEYLRMNTTTDG